MKKVKIPVAILLILGLGTLSCLDFTKEKPPKKAAKVKVNLPEKPNLAIKHPPKRFVDGSYSVEGFLNNINKIKGHSVKITGYVKVLNLCPQGEDVVCNIEPSVILADYQNGPSKKVRVFALPEHTEQFEGLKVGQKVQFKGKPSMTSPRGTMVELDGLFILDPPADKEDKDTSKK
jgi:hypothetical protein